VPHMTQVMVASAISDTSADDRAGIRGSRPRAGYRGDGHRSPAGRGTDTTRRYPGPRQASGRLSQTLLAHPLLGACHRLACQRSNPRSASSQRAARTRAVLARAPRDLPCSPREPCRPGERGAASRNGSIGGADAAHPRNIRTAAEASAPPARLAPGRLRCLGHGRRPSPARRRGPVPGTSGWPPDRAAHAAGPGPPHPAAAIGAGEARPGRACR
jgi:hypothetical protein